MEQELILPKVRQEGGEIKIRCEYLIACAEQREMQKRVKEVKENV